MTKKELDNLKSRADLNNVQERSGVTIGKIQDSTQIKYMYELLALISNIDDKLKALDLLTEIRKEDINMRYNNNQQSMA